MERTLTPFESSLKNTIDRHEAPFSDEGWNFIEQQLGAAKPASGTVEWVAWAAASVVLALSSWLVYDYHFDVPEARIASGAGRLQAWQQPLTHQGSSGADLVLDSATASIAQVVSADVAVTPGSATVVPTSTPQEASTPSGVTAPAGKVDATSAAAMQPEAQSNIPAALSHAGRAYATALFNTSVRKACAGNPVEFKLSNSPGSASYLWNFGDGTFSSQPNPSHIYTKPGVYDVSLSITDADGLIKSTVMEDLITINPTPESEFEWDFISGATDEPTVKFINMSENATKFNWTFDEKNNETEISPVKSYITRGKHSVELYVENEFGCSDVTVRYLTINSDYNLLAPGTISPDNDGKEDCFMPEALKENNFNFVLTVYDGSKPVFTSNNKNKPWTGKLKDGSIAPVGSTYPWVVIIYNSITKEEKYFSGSVTIAP